MSFEESFQSMLRLEGIYSNRIDDGETVYGISRNYWTKLPMWHTVDEITRSHRDPIPKLKALFEEKKEFYNDIKYFYQANFWDVNNLDSVNAITQQVAEYVFDTGVNQGTGFAATMLQNGLNFLNRNQIRYRDLFVDGKIGPRTLAALKECIRTDEARLLKVLKILRGERYLDILRRRPWDEQYIGWIDRI
jgi:lysozyme family protein